MKLNRSRRDAWILERPTSPRLAPQHVAAAPGALGLTGSVAIAHFECPLCSARRLTSGCLLEYGGAMKRTSPEISLENSAHGLSAYAGAGWRVPSHLALADQNDALYSGK